MATLIHAIICNMKYLQRRINKLQLYYANLIIKEKILAISWIVRIIRGNEFSLILKDSLHFQINFDTYEADDCQCPDTYGWKEEGFEWLGQEIKLVTVEE